MKKTYIVLFGLLVTIGLPQNLVATAALEDVDKQEETWEQEQLAQRQQAARAVMQNLTPEQEKLGKQLLAARRGQTEEVKKLIAQGAPLNFQDDRGQTALYLSILKRDVEMTRVLVTAGADVNIMDNYNHTPLLNCCWDYLVSDLDVIKLLLKAGAQFSINQQTSDKYRTTALIQATKLPYFYSIQVIELLLAARADTSINYQKNTGNTALMEAVGQRNEKAIRRLIFANARLDIKNNAGNTALTMPIYVHASNRERLAVTSFMEKALTEKKRSSHMPTELEEQLPLPIELIEIILDYEQDPTLRDQQRSAQKQAPMAENTKLRKTQCSKCSKCAIL